METIQNDFDVGEALENRATYCSGSIGLFPKKIHPEGEPYVFCEDCQFFREEVIRIWGVGHKRDWYCDYPENLEKHEIDAVRRDPGVWHRRETWKINEDNACKWYKERSLMRFR